MQAKIQSLSIFCGINIVYKFDDFCLRKIRIVEWKNKNNHQYNFILKEHI